MKTQKFDNIPSDTLNTKRYHGDKVLNVKGVTIRYGFYVRQNVLKTTMNVLFIVAENWHELRCHIISRLDLIADDLDEATARYIFEAVVALGESATFTANGKEYIVER